jgi:phosphomannomutase
MFGFWTLLANDAHTTVLDKVEQRYSGCHIFKLDGVSVQADSWWVNVRPSNTEPVIRLTAESKVDSAELARLVSEAEQLIATSGGTRVT